MFLIELQPASQLGLTSGVVEMPNPPSYITSCSSREVPRSFQSQLKHPALARSTEHML